MALIESCISKISALAEDETEFWKKSSYSLLTKIARVRLSLAKFKDPNPALLIIDVQKQFCDPAGGKGTEETVKIAKRIAALAPEFRNAGVPVYPIYYPESRKETPDYFEFYPDRKDTVLIKSCDSAFKGGPLASTLLMDKRRTLLVCGFNLSACVMRTVDDALWCGFKVKVLRNLSGNGVCETDPSAETLENMAAAGAEITDAATELKALKSSRIASGNDRPAMV